MLNEERWATIPRATNYEISESGIIKRRIDSQNKMGGIVKRGYVPKQHKDKDGYPNISLHCDEEKKRRLRVHRLVLEAFFGECPEGMEANHIDGIKTNNHISNLEWISHEENVRHAFTIGLREKGEKNPMAKLKDGEVWFIKKLLASDMYKEKPKPHTGLTDRNIGRMFNVDSATIGNIKRERSWSHIKYEEKLTTIDEDYWEQRLQNNQPKRKRDNDCFKNTTR